MNCKGAFKIPAIPPTTSKTIRFPNNIIQEVEVATKGTDCTFSAFVIEATRYALEAVPTDHSVIHWKSKDVRPEEGSYILLKTLDEEGQVICESGAYENEMFIFIYGEDEWSEVNDAIFLGWAYYPYDKRGAVQEKN